MEIWKDVPSFEGYYKVSSTGKILGVKRNKERKICLNEDGYPIISMSKPPLIQKTITIHRLVAENFVPNPNNLPEVNHLDGDKLNNNDWNLEWTNRKGNILHALETGLNVTLSGAKSNRAVMTDEIVDKCINLRKTKLSYQKITDMINREFGTNISRTTINEALLGNTWKEKGVNFRKINKSSISI